MNEMVILVDQDDRETGTMEKMAAHEQGLLHRAFSVFVFNTRGEILMQQRATGKYHSGGLWTNTCCSHPRPGEPLEVAARRRLREEMGLSCELREKFSFIYFAPLANSLIEYEFDHVFTGITDANPAANPSEVESWKYMSQSAVTKDMLLHSEQYTEWFKICLTEYAHELFNPTLT